MVSDKHREIKKWIFIYFWLLLFEGALRKWFLPSLATPLLIIRDPIALMIYFQAYRKKAFPRNHWVEITIALAIFSSLFTMLFGHRNFEVLLFGLRANFLHIPLIFIMGRVLNQDDIEKIIRIILFLIPPITVLLVLQFYSPPDAWVNRGLGGVGTAGFAGAGGKMRPPTIFSFIVGTVHFYTLAISCCIWAPFMYKKVSKSILILCIMCSLLALPMSISRGLVFASLIVLIGYLFALINSSTYRKYLGRIVIALVLTILLAPRIPFMGEAIETFMMRWDNVTANKGGSQIPERVFYGFIDPLLSLDRVPIFGHGLGMGTNAGSKLLTGEVTFIIAEGEWGRAVGELGLLGYAFLFTRVGVTLYMMKKAWELTKRGNMLAWVLLMSCFIDVIQGQWGQSTSLGFSIFTAGMVMAVIQSNLKSTNFIDQQRGYQPARS